MEEELLTVYEVAALLKCSKLTVYGLVSKRKIPCIKISERFLRFRKSDLMSWLGTKSQEVGGRQSHSARKSCGRTREQSSDIKGIVELARKEVLGT